MLFRSEELFPRCGGEGVLDVERGSEAGAVFDTEPCPGCPDCLFADHDTTAIDQALAKGAEEERERLREAFRDKDVLFDRDRLQRAVFAALDTAVPSED